MIDKKEVSVIKSVKDMNSSKMNDTRIAKKDKMQYIQVFVRVRPTNHAEKVGKAVTVVDTPSNNEIIIRERPHDKFTKKFTFDKVFGPQSRQLEVYNEVVSPLLEEALAGYNCTVFAYGQTGTGKTFTMEGSDSNPLLHWQTDSNAGIIPRALGHLFDELQLLGTEQYSVRVSFLELYNEEVLDLLSTTDDAAKIRIYEDPTKKGAVIVQGLEEVRIHNKNEVFKILQKGSDKRQTAATLMNAHSSRSHTIFSITINIKETTVDGVELLKTGKLNLVDLAGSENVGRSGAVDRRAREAGNINQSLLTLGRVITSLVEKSPHVPYRESKLTRLLQESLGGRTRTSIIATISPASINLEETLSTLDYAHRAKNITNRPEINQKFSKKGLLIEYTEEIERLKKDLLATRERNGIYLTPDSYNEMQSMIEFQSKDIEEKVNRIKALEECMNSKEQIFNELRMKSSEQANELLNVKNQLETTVHSLMSTSSRLTMSEREREEQKHLVEKHASTEDVLLTQVQTVLGVADTATDDVHKLHDKVYRKIQVGQRNSCVSQQFKHNIRDRIKEIENDIAAHSESLSQFQAFMRDRTDVTFGEDVDKWIQLISQDLVNNQQCIMNELTKNINDSYLGYREWLKSVNKDATSVAEKCSMLNKVSLNVTQKIQQLVEFRCNVAKGLENFKAAIFQDIDNLVESTKEVVSSISKTSLEKRNRLDNDMRTIREEIKTIRRDQSNIREERAHFAKMLADLQQCLEEVQEEEEENYTSLCDTLNNVDEKCQTINNHVSDAYRVNREKGNDLQRILQNDLEVVKQVVAEGTDKSRTMTENLCTQRKMLISQVQDALSKNTNTVTNYESCMQRNISETQQRMELDEGFIRSAINDMSEKVQRTSNAHAQCLNDCREAFANASTEMSQQLDSENTNAMNMNSRIITEMEGVLNEVDKFFAEDLYRDVPTGSTPARKEFQYSRTLIKTSPHERILKRYRETLENIEQEEDVDCQSVQLLNNNTSTKEAVNVS